MNIRSKFKKGWNRLWSKPENWYWFGIPLGGYLAVFFGIAVIAGIDTSMKMSSSVEFCTSCHEMATFVYPDYRKSLHFSNQSGVAATCSDCHVPKAWLPKLGAKIRATFVEVPHHLLGTIDSQEKFDIHKYELAARVWARMRANDSQPCRNCHSRDAMNLDLQDRSARRKHTKKYAEEKGKTCIDCHSGLVHPEPDEPDHPG